MMLVLQVLGVFSLLSVLAVGGGAAVLPEMKALTACSVDCTGPLQFQWITTDQFGQIYSLGQLAPGPNMLMVSVIGYHVAGYAGALMALVGFFLPAGVITFYAGRTWDRFADSPWRASIARGLGPVTVGLILAGTWSVAKTVMIGHGATPYAVAVVVTVILLRVKLNPILLILGGGAATWVAKAVG